MLETTIEWLKVPGASAIKRLISLDLWSVSSASLKQDTLWKRVSKIGNKIIKSITAKGPEHALKTKYKSAPLKFAPTSIKNTPSTVGKDITQLTDKSLILEQSLLVQKVATSPDAKQLNNEEYVIIHACPLNTSTKNTVIVKIMFTKTALLLFAKNIMSSAGNANGRKNIFT
jgi:hypothetical protein